MRVIGKANLIEFYTSVLSYGTVHKVEICSLEEFLSLASTNEGDAPKVFDDEADKRLEEYALKRFHEGQKKHG